MKKKAKKSVKKYVIGYAGDHQVIYDNSILGDGIGNAVVRMTMHTAMRVVKALPDYSVDRVVYELVPVRVIPALRDARKGKKNG